jgi:hypothetical protein
LLFISCSQTATSEKETSINCATANDVTLEGFKGKPKFVSVKHYQYKDSLGIQVIDTSEYAIYRRFDTSGQITYCKVISNNVEQFSLQYDHENGITTQIHYLPSNNATPNKSYRKRKWIDSFSYSEITHSYYVVRNRDTTLYSESIYTLDKQCRLLKKTDTAHGAFISEYPPGTNSYRQYRTDKKGNILSDLIITIVKRDNCGNPLLEEAKENGKEVTRTIYTYEYY